MKKSIKYLKIFANLLVGVLTIVVFLYFAPKLVVFFIPLVVGYLISWIANPVVRFFEKRLKLPEFRATCYSNISSIGRPIHT